MTVVFGDLANNHIQEANLGRNVHGHLKSLEISELVELTAQDRFPFEVMALNVAGDLNIGTIIRQSHLNGAERVWIFGRRKIDSRGAVGASAYTLVERVNGLDDDLNYDVEAFWSIIETNNFYPVFVEQGGTTLQNFKWTIPDGKKLLIVLGNEGDGVPAEFLHNQTVVSIPQRGVIRSHNVSSASAMVMWDMRCKLGWF